MCNDDFCEAVQQYISRNLGDWADDYDTSEFDEMVADMVRIIWNEAGDGSRLYVYRKELRPKEQVESHQYGSVGQFWSWTERGAGVCHHDNGYDEHQSRDLVEIMLEGTVDINDVNWTATIAKNFILKGEREVTVKPNASIKVEYISSREDAANVNLILPVRSNGHEDDF